MNEKVAKAILDTPGCFKSKIDKPSILSIRQLTPYIIDPRVVNSYPNQRDVIVEGMADFIDGTSEIGGNLDKLVTSAEYNIPICSMVGYRMGVGMAYSPRFECIEKGEDVVGADYLFADENVVKVIDAIRRANADIDDYCFVFNRNHGTSKSFFGLGIKIHSLVDMSDDFIISALKNENIKGSEYEIFRECVENPVEWSRNYILKNPDYLKKRLAEVIINGRVNNKAPLEVITIGHPELKDKYEPIVRGWLTELGVKHDVPEFNYKV
jgi:orotate phosphoribosyltransferase